MPTAPVLTKKPLKNIDPSELDSLVSVRCIIDSDSQSQHYFVRLVFPFGYLTGQKHRRLNTMSEGWEFGKIPMVTICKCSGLLRMEITSGINNWCNLHR